MQWSREAVGTFWADGWVPLPGGLDALKLVRGDAGWRILGRSRRASDTNSGRVQTACKQREHQADTFAD